MNYYPINNFELSGIMEADDNIHKYLAILMNLTTKNISLLPFGNIYDTHYRDTTQLNSYSHLDTNNLNHRTKFILENQLLIRGGYYNATYFEMKYLYSFDQFLINSNV